MTTSHRITCTQTTCPSSQGSRSLSTAQNATPLARDRGPDPQTYLAGTVTTFLDQPTFAAAAGSTTLIDFESFADGTEINTELASFGIANVTGTSDFEVPPGPTTQFVYSSATLPFPMFIAGTPPTETNYFANRIDFPGPAGTGTILLEFSSPASRQGRPVSLRRRGSADTPPGSPSAPVGPRTRASLINDQLWLEPP